MKPRGHERPTNSWRNYEHHAETRRRSRATDTKLAVADAAVRRLAMPAATMTGIIAGLLGIALREPALYSMGGLAMAMAAILWVQSRRGGSLATAVAATCLIVLTGMAPFAEGGFRMAVVPTLAIIIGASIFTTPPRAARILAVCGAAALAWSAAFTYAGLNFVDYVILGCVLGGTAVAAYLVFWWVEEARVDQEESYAALFEETPIATMERDYSTVAAWISRQRQQGVKDFETLLQASESVKDLYWREARLRRGNEAALQLFGAENAADLHEKLSGTFGGNSEEIRTAILKAMWEGGRIVRLPLRGVFLGDQERAGVFTWLAPGTRRPDYSRTIITIADATPILAAEARAAEAESATQMLTRHEDAVAEASRALLLGSDETGVREAAEAIARAGEGWRVKLTRYHETEERVVAEAGETDGVSIYEASQKIERGGEVLGEISVEISEEVTPAMRTSLHRMLEVTATMIGACWEREDHLQALEELVAAKDQFVSSVGHELRTPLASVVGFAELLGDGLIEPDEQAEIGKLIASQGRDLAAVIEDLLVAGRASVGAVTIRPVRAGIRDAIQTVIDSVAGAERIELVGISEDDETYAWADETRLRQILRNLVTNIIRYGGDRARVEVEEVAAKEDGLIQIRAVDNGGGIAEAEQEAIFQAYQRASNSRHVPQSMGLGLAVARQLAELMGGDLTYTYTGGESIFTLTVPKYAGQDQDQG